VGEEQSFDEFPSHSAAQAAVDAIRFEINQQTPQQLIKNISFETLANHYREHELPDIFNKTKPVPDFRKTVTKVPFSSCGIVLTDTGGAGR
jgi:hypothetical protein